jgi:isoprenylcysteine carboxyl methyltransferase (ICMT) family protein YpbQ
MASNCAPLGDRVRPAFLIALIVLPFYVGILAERIKAERAEAEEALKEFLERERRGS